MTGTVQARRRIGLVGWLALAAVTLAWLWQARGSLPWWAWPVVLAPFAALLPGLLRPSRNAWLLALLATIGYASMGFMDAIANPGAAQFAYGLAGMSLVSFFSIIPAVRTLPAPPRDDSP